MGVASLTLEPLRTHGADALDTTHLPAIIRIVLREIEITWTNVFHRITICRADDLFDCTDEQGLRGNPIPESGILIRAVFDVQFADSPIPRPVEIRAPHILKLVRGSDADLLEPWLIKSGFRTTQKFSHFLAATLLIIVTALAPAFDDDPTDADDDDDDIRGRPISPMMAHRPSRPTHDTNTHPLAVP